MIIPDRARQHPGGRGIGSPVLHVGEGAQGVDYFSRFD
jgi:hypothetical protein